MTVKFGIDRLLADPALRASLQGKRVALLAHPASVTADLTHSVDALVAAGIDQDPVRVAAFWSALLERPVGPSEEGWVYLGERSDPLPRLVFQPVPEPSPGKVRIHLDIEVDDLEAATHLVRELGGRATGERHEHPGGVVAVMVDPEDHEFCLVEYV